MARVFVSYRRADGVYAVGWIVERLERMGVGGMQSAFHDGDLRDGDDFARALDAEVESCDVVIAVMGREWMGRRTNGRARIQDPDDWIVRELSSSLRQHKRVVPVRIGGVEPPLASELHPDIAEIARLQGRPLSEASDLDRLERCVASHLEEIDQERAKRDGLNEPVELPPFPHLRLTATSALVAAIVFGIVPILLPASQFSGRGWMVSAAIAGATAGAVAAVSIALDRWISLVATFRWRKIGLGAALLVVVTSLVSVNIAQVSNLAIQYWIALTLFSAALAAPAIAATAVAVSMPGTTNFDLAGRARHIRVLLTANRQGLALLAILCAAAGPILVVRTVSNDSSDSTGFEIVSSISLAALMAGILLAVHLWTEAKLAPIYAELTRDLTTLPERYVDNAGLDWDGDRLAPTRVAFIVLLPVLVALPVALWAVLG